MCPLGSFSTDLCSMVNQSKTPRQNKQERSFNLNFQPDQGSVYLCISILRKMQLFPEEHNPPTVVQQIRKMPVLFNKRCNPPTFHCGRMFIQVINPACGEIANREGTAIHLIYLNCINIPVQPVKDYQSLMPMKMEQTRSMLQTQRTAGFHPQPK